MRKYLAIPAVLAAIFAGCGDSDTNTDTTNSSETAVNVADTTIEPATEAEVTEKFHFWRARKAQRVTNNAVAVSISDVNCTLKSEGNATCIETVAFDSKFASLDKSETLAWDVEYESDGRIVYAKTIN